MTTTPQNLDVGKFNDFINNANALLSCDETCQRDKKQMLLKEKFLKAKVNYMTAPAQVENSYKNYLTYTEGDDAYNEHHKKRLSEKARELAKQFASEFEEQIQKAKGLVSTYDGLLVNFAHVVEYYDDLVQKNKIMSLSLKNKSSDIVTNDRKTFYEDQKVDSLYFYYRIILFIYLVVLISYAVSIIFRPADMGRKKQTIILVIFIIYPFIAARLFLYVGDLYDKLKNLLPKNVYKNEASEYSPHRRKILLEHKDPHEQRVGGCNGTRYGCCSDGITTKVDEAGTNCEGYVPPCGESIYGCCSDGITTKVDEAGTNCKGYVPPCDESIYGCCSDGITTKVDTYGTNCPLPCIASTFGCCSDRITTKEDESGSNCPKTT
jgi:hypothetical protein